ncbi:MAG: type 4a pilus biogenesis protein PilO [Candidatus Parcubacteria bacterium]|nr:type 4a pilus biogenesis protein PilO [Candidatus Parcubacteria bacterium]
MNNGKIKKTIILFIIVDAILFFLYLGLFFATHWRNTQTQEIYASFYQQTSDAETLKRLESSLSDTEKQRALLNEHLITPSQTLTFIEQIESLGKQSLADVQVTSVASPKKKGEPFLLEFTASGGFENIYRLFSLVEEMPYRVTIRKVNLLANPPSNELPSSWRASFTIVLDSYLMP